MNQREFDRRLADLVQKRRENVPPPLLADLQREIRTAEQIVLRRRLFVLPSLRLAAAVVVVLFGLGIGATLLLRDAVPAGPALLHPPAPARLVHARISIPAVQPAQAVSILRLLPGRAIAVRARLAHVAPPLSNEIRTEFEIAGKDIRIIWVQKPDFNLRRNQP